MQVDHHTREPQAVVAVRQRIKWFTKRRIFVLLGFVLVTFLLVVVVVPRWIVRQGAAQVPALSFDANEWDFGVVRKEQALLSHTFQVTNHGSDPIELRVTKMGCNCLAVECPEVVESGSTASVKVDLEPRNREGQFTTYVLFGTSDPVASAMHLNLSFYAEPPIGIDPPLLAFRELQQGEVRRVEFRVITRFEAGQPPSPPQVETFSEAIQCEYVNTTVGTGPASGSPELRRAIHVYQATLTTQKLPKERSHLPGALRFSLPGVDSPTVVYLPLEIDFCWHSRLRGATSTTLSCRKKPPESRVSLWTRDGTPFTITEVKSSLPGLTGRPLSKEPAKNQLVLLSMKATEVATPPRIAKAAIDIKTVEFPDEEYHLDVLVLP